MREDLQRHRPAVVGREADRARDARGRLAGEELEVVRGDRAVAGADLHRRALARVLERLGVDAAGRRERVGDRVDAGDRAAHDVQRPGRDVARAAAAEAVAAHAHDRALGGHRAVLRPAAVGLADRRAELDLARDDVERVVALERRRVDEVLAQLPALPVTRLRVLDLEPLAAGRLEHRRVAEPERLARRAVAQPEHLALGARRVRRLEQRADRRRGDRVDLGRVRVGRGRAGAGLVVDPAAQPAQPLAGERLDGAARRALQLDRAGAVVEAAGEVLEHLGVLPVAVARADLPAQRRVLGIDARAARGRGLHRDLDHQLPDVLLEAEVERVADERRGAERQLVGALRARRPVDDADLRELVAALDHVRRGRGGRDREVLVDLEDDRLLGRGPAGADLGRRAGDLDLPVGRRAEPEAQLRERAGRPVEPDPEQLHQRDVELVRHAVEPVDRHLRHPREQLDQRDAGIGDVVLGPLRAGPVDAHPRLGDEVLEAAVVELDRRELHSLSSSGIT